MSIRNAPSSDHPIAFLKERAKAMRRHMLRMSRAMGQGYLAQGLGIADALTAIYFHELRYDPAALQWPQRDRFILSTGHYSIALWAAFAEAGIVPLDELDSYGRDGSRLAMSTMDSTPGVEMIGGSLGHGLGQAVGMALGLRLNNTEARVFVEFSDGDRAAQAAGARHRDSGAAREGAFRARRAARVRVVRGRAGGERCLIARAARRSGWAKRTGARRVPWSTPRSAMRWRRLRASARTSWAFRRTSPSTPTLRRSAMRFPTVSSTSEWRSRI